MQSYPELMFSISLSVHFVSAEQAVLKYRAGWISFSRKWSPTTFLTGGCKDCFVLKISHFCKIINAVRL